MISVVWRDAVGGLVKVEVKQSHAESRIIDQLVEQGVASMVREKFWEELQICFPPVSGRIINKSAGILEPSISVNFLQIRI